MTNHSRYDIRKLLPVLLLCAQVSIARADCPLQDSSVPDDWTAPYPAHRVIGPVYAVGNAGLGVYLVATPDGHLLINTGLENSAAQIRESIESVGYRLEDVRILLTMQAHWDHTAALAEIKDITGARMWATAGDYAGTFRKQKAMKVDVWVAAHGSQYGLGDKHGPGQPYSPDTFVDPEGFLAAVERLEQVYLDQLQAEAGR